MVQLEYLKTLKNKDIYIWGLGVFGLALLADLRREGIKVKGIIDKRSRQLTCGAETYQGITLFKGIDEIESISDAFFVITATKPQSIREICESIKDTCVLEEHRGVNYIIANDEKSIYVDISGVCNLRCKSCQVSNHDPCMYDYSNRGFMSTELYEKILSKIKKDFPQNKCIFLYIFGDPLLNKSLAEIIDITHKYGMYAILSTNLSMEVDMEKIVKANPNSIKISVSGFSQEIYGTTHNGGNIALVKANMYYLSYLIQKYKATTNVIVGYHLYNNNDGYEKEKMEELCQECGFLFQTVVAGYQNSFKRWGMAEFTDDDRNFINTYYSNPDDILHTLSMPKGINRCGYLDDGLFVDYDGKVLLCCSIMHKEGIYGNYLQNSLEDINNERRKSWICKKCMEFGDQN